MAQDTQEVQRKVHSMRVSGETQKEYDIILIGAGSAGLSVGLFMNKAGFKVLLIDKADEHIGGDCLNDGCVPSKALIHVSRIMHEARKAEQFGLKVTGEIDIQRATQYVHDRQAIIRKHENAEHFRKEGLDVVLGVARFTGRNEIQVGSSRLTGKKIVIATGSRPRKLTVPGIESVTSYDNESIFDLKALPKQLLVVGGGPIGIELGQALCRLGSKVTVVNKGTAILEHDDPAVTSILQQQLEKEGMEFVFEAEVARFTSPHEAKIKLKGGDTRTIPLDAVFVAVGRQLNIEGLDLDKAGIEVREGKIVVDDRLRTTNKDVFTCGDVSGSLQFSHAAEQQARLLLNNFFSPINKKLHNDHMSWVTFTDPEVATFGQQEEALRKRGMSFRKLETDFVDDDRAITDNYRFGKLVLYISQGSFLHKEKVLGGTMVAPGAGELIQELILAQSAGIPINAIFNKIYPYPVAARINQKAVVQYKQDALTETLKKLLRFAFKLFS